MKVTTGTWIATVLALCAGGFAIYESIKCSNKLDVARKEMKNFCRSTKNNVYADLSALKSGNPSLQKGAILRIVDDRIYSGDSSAQLCLKQKMPDSEAWSECLIPANVPCVLARTETLYKLLSKEEGDN